MVLRGKRGSVRAHFPPEKPISVGMSEAIIVLGEGLCPATHSCTRFRALVASKNMYDSSIQHKYSNCDRGGLYEDWPAAGRARAWGVRSLCGKDAGALWRQGGFFVCAGRFAGASRGAPERGAGWAWRGWRGRAAEQAEQTLRPRLLAAKMASLRCACGYTSCLYMMYRALSEWKTARRAWPAPQVLLRML